jgi:hypothetical protein
LISGYVPITDVVRRCRRKILLTLFCFMGAIAMVAREDSVEYAKHLDLVLPTAGEIRFLRSD